MATAKKNASRKTAPAVAVAQVGEVTLEQIVEATKAGSFVYTAPAVHAPLIEAGLVEVNPAMTDENGNVATRATQKGIESLDSAATVADNATSATAATGETQKVKTMFKIEDSIPVPTISGRGRGDNVYPFDQLEVGQSFFVANSEDKPNAAKSLASTVSSATARYAVGTGEFKTVKVKDYQTDEKGEKVKTADGKFVVIGEHDEQREVMRETRKFVVRSVEENDVKGARVWRTA